MGQSLSAMVVGDSGRERARVMSWFPGHWAVIDGGSPASALDAVADGPCTAVVYTAGTSSVDLETWHQALMIAGYGGAIIDTRPSGVLPDGVVRAPGPRDLAHVLDD